MRSLRSAKVSRFGKQGDLYATAREFEGWTEHLYELHNAIDDAITELHQIRGEAMTMPREDIASKADAALKALGYAG